MGRRSDYRDYGYTRAVWNGLYNLINNEIGLAALLGNLWAESGIVPVSYTHLTLPTSDLV